MNEDWKFNFEKLHNNFKRLLIAYKVIFYYILLSYLDFWFR